MVPENSGINKKCEKVSDEKRREQKRGELFCEAKLLLSYSNWQIYNSD